VDVSETRRKGKLFNFDLLFEGSLILSFHPKGKRMHRLEFLEEALIGQTVKEMIQVEGFKR